MGCFDSSRIEPRCIPIDRYAGHKTVVWRGSHAPAGMFRGNLGDSKPAFLGAKRHVAVVKLYALMHPQTHGPIIKPKIVQAN